MVDSAKSLTFFNCRHVGGSSDLRLLVLAI